MIVSNISKVLADDCFSMPISKVSSKNQCSSFLKKFSGFQKTCLKVKYVKLSMSNVQTFQ